MRARLMIFRLAALAVMVLSLSHVTPAFACSGPGPTMDDILGSGSKLVKARVVERDAVSQNYILQVESYIFGEPGAEYLFLQLNSPALVFGLQIGYEGGGDCDGLFEPLPDEPFYMFVRRDSFGFYRSPGGVFTELYYDFPEADSLVSIRIRKPGTRVEDEENMGYRLTEVGFLSFMAQRMGNTPQPPLADQTYPRKSPLLLTDDRSTNYVLPIDQDTPFEVFDETLSHALTRFPDDFLLISDNWSKCYESPPPCRFAPLPGFHAVQRYVDDQPDVILNGYGRPMVMGDDARVSPLGDMAIWDNRTLGMYSSIAGLPVGVADMKPYLSVELDGAVHEAVWSPNGEKFAFSDDAGVWVALMDIRIPAAERRAELVLPNEDTDPQPLQFSPDGDYLVVEDQGMRYTLDLETGEQQPYRIYSPDMQHFLDLHPDDPAGFTVSLDGDLEIADQVVDAEWLDSATAILQMDDSVGWYNLSGTELASVPGTAFVIAESGEVGVLTDEDTVWIDQQTLDMAQSIAEIRWLPTLWVFPGGE